MLKETLVIFATCWAMLGALAILSWLAPEAWWLVQFTWYHAGWVLLIATAIWLGRQRSATATSAVVSSIR